MPDIPATIKNAVRDIHWMARRYADGRCSYAPSMFNGRVRDLLNAGFELEAPLFARDGMGRAFDGLSDEEVAAAEGDMPRMHTKVFEIAEDRMNAVWDEAVEACIAYLATKRKKLQELGSDAAWTVGSIELDLADLKRSDKTGCQGSAGAKGDTVSREGALQAGLGADAFYLDQSAWEGLRPAVRWRLGAAVAKLIRTGTLNRQDIEEIGEVSTPQASADIAEIMKRLPHLMSYDKSRKCYVLAANSQSQIEERSDTERPASAEGSLTHKINQDQDNG